MAEPSNTAFLAGVDRWVDVLGRLRDVVRQEVLAVQLAEIAGPEPQRVLDVGCGQGTQALVLARAGHDVTGVDISPDLLARFEAALDDDTRPRVHLLQGAAEDLPALVRGEFDLVMCHGVLMYFDDVVPILTSLTAVSSPGTTLSLLVRNGLATAMRDGLRGNWQAALDAFDSKDYVNRLGLPAHAHTPADLEQVLVPLGWQLASWQGVRVFTDHLDAEAPDDLGLMIRAEVLAGSRDPYRQVAALLHVVFTRT